jgi:hypothetical protein
LYTIKIRFSDTAAPIPFQARISGYPGYDWSFSIGPDHSGKYLAGAYGMRTAKKQAYKS